MIKKQAPIFLILLIILQTVAATSSHRFQSGENPDYWLGLNYPWLGYGHDFGANAWGHDGVSAPNSASQLEADFAEMKSLGVQVVRWFVFGDGRASPEFDAEGLVTGFDEQFYADFDKALEISQKNEISLMPVLWDFRLAALAEDVNGVQVQGRSALLSNAQVQQSFLDNALRPLLERYGQNPTIIAWDIINEPEGAMIVDNGQWVGEAVSVETMLEFVNNIANYIHTYASQPVTVGSASRGFLPLWAESNLDFYQYHYYDHMEQQFPFDYAAADLGLNKPVLVGEFPTKNTERTLTQYLDTIWQNGYMGALAWSYRGGDDASDFQSSAAEFAAWSQAHPGETSTSVAATTTSKFDFETDEMGWYAQDWVDSMACTQVRQSNLYAKDGQYSLECVMELVGGDPNNNLTKGEALVDLQYQVERQLVLPHNVPGESIPLNLDGHTITIWVYAPEGSRGVRNSPNGFQVFVKDSQFKSEYGIWHNIMPASEYNGQPNAVIEGQWSPVTLMVASETTAPRGVWLERGFDPTHIIVIGLKMGAGNSSTYQYQGSIYIDAVDWD